MNDGWPLVPLGEVLAKSEEWVDLHPDTEYRQVTVRMWGKGVVERTRLQGSEIAASRQIIVRAGQFILSRIDARHGAFGLVPGTLDGAVISSDFPTFTLNESRIIPAFLDWMSKTHNFIDLCRAASEGTTNRVRLKEDRFLGMEIPLPPLAEQRRIVARIEALAARLEEARKLRDQTLAEAELLWSSALRACFQNDTYTTISLEAVCEAIIDNLHSTPKYDGDEFPCIRSQDVGWGTMNFATALRTSEAEFLQRTQRGEPRAGDIVYVREGDIGRCALVDGSQRFSLGQRVMMLRPNGQIIKPRLLLYQLMAPTVLDDQVRNAKTGTTSHHVNISYLKQVQLHVPSLPDQRRIVTHLDALQARVDALRAAQAATAAELAALLPAILDRAFKGEF